MLSVEEYNAKYAKTIDFEKGIDNKIFGNADYRVFLAGEYHAQTKGYQSKKMLELKIDANGNGNCYPCMGCRSFLTPYVDENAAPKYYGDLIRESLLLTLWI